MPVTVCMRIFLVILFLGGLFGLTIWYGSLTPNPNVGAFPDEEHLATDYQRYPGEEVVVDGIVRTTSPVTIATEYGDNEVIYLTITDLSIPVTESHHLRVYGVARPDDTVQSINAVAVPPSGLYYTWTVSSVAGLWVLSRITRDWTLETETWTLQRRTTTLGRTQQPKSPTNTTPPEEVTDDA